jgi:hypothetical protein
MFWATVCPRSGEITVSMRHLVFVTLECRVEWNIPPCIPEWQIPGVAQIQLFLLIMGTQSPETRREKKYVRKNCAPSWLYLQDYTRMHSQQNMKLLEWLLRWDIRKVWISQLAYYGLLWLVNLWCTCHSYHDHWLHAWTPYSITVSALLLVDEAHCEAVLLQRDVYKWLLTRYSHKFLCFFQKHKNYW